jgi:S-adenosylmethionine:tRNA ribosyltransferase-isomerase
MALGSNLSDYDFDLDESLIAQKPLEKRDDSKLLVIRRHPSAGLPRWEEALMKDLPELLAQSAPHLLRAYWLRNCSRVFPARFYALRESGATHEIVLIEEEDGGTWRALVKRSARMKFPQRLSFVQSPSEHFEVVEKDRVKFPWPREELLQRLQQWGEMPLPPYIRDRERTRDVERYQSVWAAEQEAKSAAAPTASLHFTPELCARLEGRGVEFLDSYLHVGLGTFEPLRQESLAENELHSEAFSVPPATLRKLEENFHGASTARRPVLSIGTTALRCLESLPLAGQASRAEHIQEMGSGLSGRTRLFVRPGFDFRYTDALLTNFHLPKSSLLVLLSCFAGSWELVKETYALANRQRYRFFSYGDASLWL